MNNFIVKLQKGIMFRQEVSRPDKISTSISEKFADIFDAPTVSLPIPADAPADIPRAELKSSTNRFTAVISKSRFDIHYMPEFPENVSEITDVDEDNKKMEEIISHCIEMVLEQKVEINRMVNFVQYAVTENNPAKIIGDALLSKDLGELSQLRVRFNKEISLDKFSLNNLTVIEDGTGQKHTAGGVIKETVLLVTRDINNIMPNENSLSKEDIQKIFNESSKLIGWDSVSVYLE